jgi:hypothetical protein
MKATVTQLISGEGYTDKQRRVQLRFADATCGFNEVRVPVASLGVDGVALDDVLEVRMVRIGDVGDFQAKPPLNSKSDQAFVPTKAKPVVEGKW